MNNHERAKNMLDVLRRDLTLDKGIVDGLEFALDATEPKPEPKGRPAFLGDRVKMALDEMMVFIPNSGTLLGECRSKVWVLWDGEDEAHTPVRSCLRHLDGTPVSRVVPMPREIKESQLLTLDELEDGEWYIAVYEKGDTWGSCAGRYFKNDPNPMHIGYLPVPKVKRGE